jgi:hypothetical protein
MRADPWEALAATRAGLLDVHRRILEDERAGRERLHGRMTSSEFLQLATDGRHLAWLAPLSELIVAIDEALADRIAADEALADREAQGEPPPDAAELLDRVRSLVAPPSADTPFGRQYLAVLQRSPDAVLAHGALLRSLPPARTP